MRKQVLTLSVYLCGPINGCTDEECKDWREWMTKELRGLGVRDPMRRDYRGRQMENYREIVELDKIDIASCDAILVNYNKPSVGTSMEILYAWERGKLVVVVHPAVAMPPWLLYHSHNRVNTFTEAIAILQREK